MKLDVSGIDSDFTGGNCQKHVQLTAIMEACNRLMLDNFIEFMKLKSSGSEN